MSFKYHTFDVLFWKIFDGIITRAFRTHGLSVIVILELFLSLSSRKTTLTRVHLAWEIWQMILNVLWFFFCDWENLFLLWTQQHKPFSVESATKLAEKDQTTIEWKLLDQQTINIKNISNIFLRCFFIETDILLRSIDALLTLATDLIWFCLELLLL